VDLFVVHGGHFLARGMHLYGTASCLTCCMHGYFGEQPGEAEPGERRYVWAEAPEGCWISQWRVGWGEDGIPHFIHGVLNDGSTLTALNWMNRCGEDTVVGEAGGSFTEVHGR
jgi:hypothetical protein